MLLVNFIGMNIMENNLLINILIFFAGQLITGGAIWGGIRADIRNMHATLTEYRGDLTRAHRRIDDLYSGHGHEKNGAR